MPCIAAPVLAQRSWTVRASQRWSHVAAAAPVKVRRWRRTPAHLRAIAPLPSIVTRIISESATRSAVESERATDVGEMTFVRRASSAVVGDAASDGFGEAAASAAAIAAARPSNGFTVDDIVVTWSTRASRRLAAKMGFAFFFSKFLEILKVRGSRMMRSTVHNSGLRLCTTSLSQRGMNSILILCIMYVYVVCMFIFLLISLDR